MKVLKKILIALVAIVVILVVIGFFEFMGIYVIRKIIAIDV